MMDEARHGLIALNLPIEEYAWRWQLAEEVVARLKREVSTAESHIQELEAHIGRLRETLEWVKERTTPQAGFKVFEAIDKALSSTPADSLERLRKLEAGLIECGKWRGWARGRYGTAAAARIIEELGKGELEEYT